MRITKNIHSSIVEMAYTSIDPEEFIKIALRLVELYPDEYTEEQCISRLEKIFIK
jgi:hypothetical protein